MELSYPLCPISASVWASHSSIVASRNQVPKGLINEVLLVDPLVAGRGVGKRGLSLVNGRNVRRPLAEEALVGECSRMYRRRR
jgi:hypothetical protein